MKRTIIIIVLIITSLFFLWTGFLWKFFSSAVAGSYTHAEVWKFKVKESTFIEIFKEIIHEHPELLPPNNQFPVGEKWDYWFLYTLYYKDTNQEVFTYIRESNEFETTNFAFIAIATHFDSLTPIKDIKMDRREINSDFGYFENKREIKKFEDRIVKLIEEKINSKSSKL